MKKQTKTSVVFAAAGIAFAACSASAAVIAPTFVTASHGGDHYGTNTLATYDGIGVTKIDANDPSTWSFDGNTYQNEWMGASITGGGTNSKTGFIIFDLGSSQALGDLWLFNNNYSGGSSGTQGFNIYVADAPTVALPSAPAKSAPYEGADYDFIDGGSGWSQIGGQEALAQQGIGSYTLGVTARYVAIEQLSNYGDTNGGNRTGFEEIAITAVPEPTTTALLGLGGLALILRRRK
jgi:hypothetical protein